MDPAAQPWLGRAIVLTEADGTDRIIGSCGFHSPPEPDGRVEVGYRVEPTWRRQGVASEVVRALFDWAHAQGVDRFRASVAPDNVASLAIITGLGFRQTGVQIDDIDGEELVFELDGWPPATGDDDRATSAEPSFDTLAVHAGAEPDELTGAVSPPIYQTSTFAQDGVGRPRRGYEYARSQNPTRERLERAVAALEGGAHGIAFASGSAVTAAIAELAAPGDEIVVGDDVYGGTFRYLERVRRGAGVDSIYVDLAAGPDVALGGAHRADAAGLVRDAVEPAAQGRRHRRGRGDRRAARGRGRPAAADRGRQHVRLAGPPAAARSTARTSSSTRRRSTSPVTRTRSSAWRSPRIAAVAERLRFLQNAMGAVPGPLDCFLVLRGLRTLHLRMERHGANAAAVAAWLRDRAGRRGRPLPGVRRDGLVRARPPAAPHGRTAAERAIAIAEGTRLFTLAESLGGVESLIEVPAAMTHMSVAGSPLEVDPALVRLSVGIEGVDDLIADLARALDGA